MGIATNGLRMMTAVAATVLLGACATGGPATAPGGQVVTLEGRNEVPPNDSKAVGSATVTVGADRSLTVKVIASGMTPTASHIHEAAAGANGPVVVPFTKVGDNEFVSAPGAKLTDAQYAAYKAGNLYVNVHSAKNPGGEIRGQLKAQ